MIIFPFAGLSKRFADAGYNKPKYMLDLYGISVFEHSLLSFKKYFNSEVFVFIGLDINGNKLFIENCIKKHSIKSYEIILLSSITKGQAETVYLGLKHLKLSKPTEITIFNIDTFRPGCDILKYDKSTSGYLEVFEGSGNNWSYVLPDEEKDNVVKQTAEKKQISNLCCTGLYNFSNHFDLMEAYEYSLKNDLFIKGEFYIAPLYNYLINVLNRVINYNLIEQKEVIFCGVPAEYENLKNNILPNFNFEA